MQHQSLLLLHAFLHMKSTHVYLYLRLIFLACPQMACMLRAHIWRACCVPTYGMHVDTCSCLRLICLACSIWHACCALFLRASCVCILRTIELMFVYLLLLMRRQRATLTDARGIHRASPACKYHRPSNK